MANGVPELLKHVHKLFAAQVFRNSTDRELLEAFIGRHDEPAFAALVERHGAMTLSVCRRVLGNEHDAEDACQAAFLVLARKAASIRKKDSVASWLHGVAFRVASDLKKRRARRHSERGNDNVPGGDTFSEVTWREVQAILDEEVQRLPEHYRTPLVLCYLHGKARDEAAQELGWKPATLKSRLERARELLRCRLVRRGIAPSVGLLSAVFTETASAAVPAVLALATVKAALLVALGKSVGGSAVSPEVASLTEKMLRRMLMTKVKNAMALLLVIVGGSIGALAFLGWQLNSSSATNRSVGARPDAGKRAQAQILADWPMFRGNPLQTGQSTADLPDPLQVRWKFQAKDGIEGAAAIVGDTVYVGSIDEHLYALKLTDGSLKWKYQGGPFKAPPSVRNGAVYIGDENGLFHCVDAKTGLKRWTFETGQEISAGANFAGDTILVGSGDEHLYCLSMAGKEIWKFKVPGGPVLASPAVVGDRTLVAGCDSTLHVLDVGTGMELARVNIDGQTGCSSAVVGDHLYLGTMNNQFLAVDWKKAAIVWTFEATLRQQPFFASAAVTDSLVIAGSRDKMVHALGRKDGKEVWSFATRDKVDGSPVVAGKRVYAASLDGNLYVLDLAKGTQIQKLELGKGIAASPAVARNCLVIGTREGVLYCLGKK